MNNTPFVSIIVLNWNQKHLTVKCVNSILKQDYPYFEVIIVDNSSSDDSFNYLQHTYISNSRVKVYRLDKNLGFAGGHNFAFKKLSKDTEYCIFLNNDTIVEKNWLFELIKPFHVEPVVGATASFEIKNGRPQFCWGQESTTTNLIGLNTFYRTHYKTDILDTFMVNGASFAVKRDLIDVPFDADFFAYGDDLYLSWKLQLMGYRIIFVRKSVFWHYRSSSRKISPLLDKLLVFYAERNRLLNLCLFLEVKTLIKILPLVFMGMVGANFVQPSRSIIRLRSYWWLLTHIKIIVNKRKHIQLLRKMPDERILAKMSYQNNYDAVRLPGMIRGLLNHFFRYWCLMFNIRTLEMC